MAHAIHGKSAIIYVGSSSGSAASPVGQQISWSIDFDQAIVDCSPLGNDWKQFVKGMQGWSGTFAGNFDQGSKQLWNASIDTTGFQNFYLYPVGSANMGEYYYGTCWVQLGKIAEGSTTSKANTSWKATGDGTLYTAP
jgi:hypothetical protein